MEISADLGSCAGGDGRFVDDDAAAGLGDAAGDGFTVPREDGAEVDQLDGGVAKSLGEVLLDGRGRATEHIDGLDTRVERRTPDERSVMSLPDSRNLRLGTEARGKVVNPGTCSTPDL